MTPPWSNAHQETSTSDRVERPKVESFERETEWSNELARIMCRVECLNKLTTGFFIISTYMSYYCGLIILRSYSYAFISPTISQQSLRKNRSSCIFLQFVHA